MRSHSHRTLLFVWKASRGKGIVLETSRVDSGNTVCPKLVNRERSEQWALETPATNGEAQRDQPFIGFFSCLSVERLAVTLVDLRILKSGRSFCPVSLNDRDFNWWNSVFCFGVIFIRFRFSMEVRRCARVLFSYRRRGEVWRGVARLFSHCIKSRHKQ